MQDRDLLRIETVKACVLRYRFSNRHRVKGQQDCCRTGQGRAVAAQKGRAVRGQGPVRNCAFHSPMDAHTHSGPPEHLLALVIPLLHSIPGMSCPTAICYVASLDQEISVATAEVPVLRQTCLSGTSVCKDL